MFDWLSSPSFLCNVNHRWYTTLSEPLNDIKLKAAGTPPPPRLTLEQK